MPFPVPRYSSIEGLEAGLFVAHDRAAPHPRRVLDSHELILMRSGRLSLREEELEFTLSAGEAMILIAGREHAGSAEREADCSFYWLHFRSPPTSDGLPLGLPCRPRRPELLQLLLHRYLDDWHAGRHSVMSAGLAVHVILTELLAEEQGEGEQQALIGRAEAWIGHHYQEPISTREVALALGRNPDYLGRIFHRATGRSLVEAITGRRLAEVCRQLTHTARDIGEIARGAGFGDLAHFRRCFRKALGCSPSAFREQVARGYVNSD